MQKVKAPADMLQSFRALSAPDSEPLPDGLDENKETPGDETPPGIADKINRQVALKSFNLSSGWFANQFEKYCHENNLPGFDTIEKDEFLEILKIVAEKKLPIKHLKRTPEYTLIMSTVAIIGSNLWVAYQLSNQKKAGDNG